MFITSNAFSTSTLDGLPDFTASATTAGGIIASAAPTPARNAMSESATNEIFPPASTYVATPRTAATASGAVVTAFTFLPTSIVTRSATPASAGRGLGATLRRHEDAAERLLEGFHREGLRDQELCAAVRRLLTHRGRPLGGDEAESHRHPRRLDGREQLDAAHLRHVPVGEHHVERIRLERGHRLCAVARLGDAVPAEAGLPERPDDDHAHCLAVVHHENLHELLLEP